jgi:hypothetical protein
MSTRCNIEIYNKCKGESYLGAILYHHSDGYPGFMYHKLERFLKAAYEHLTEAGYPYWWDAERVAATMILLSVEDYREPLKPYSTDRPNEYGHKPYRPEGGVPVFQPCIKLHGDIDYIYKVYLLDVGDYKINEYGKYEITVHNRDGTPLPQEELDRELGKIH